MPKVGDSAICYKVQTCRGIGSSRQAIDKTRTRRAGPHLNGSISYDRYTMKVNMYEVQVVKAKNSQLRKVLKI